MEQELPTIPDNGAAALAAAFAVIMSFGGFTNVVVVATHIKYRKKMLKDSKDICIFSLAVGDLFMTSLVCPLGFWSAIAMKWTTGKAGCVWYAFITTWIGLSSMLQLALIALERHHTMSSRTANPTLRKRAVQATVSAWVIALAASCLPLFGWSEYTFEGFGLHCSIAWSSKNRKYAWYCMFLLVFFFAIPITVIGFSYAKTYLIVRRMYRNASTMWGAEAQATRQSYMAQVKISK